MSALRVVAAALMSVCLALPVAAQSRGPAEQPPTGFGGRQFVDSRGCLYLRAGVGDRTMWVPRIGNDRQPMCNQAPTFGPRPAPPPVREVAAPAAPAPVPRAQQRVGTIPVPAAAPRTAPAPLPVAAPVAAAPGAAAPGAAAIEAALQNFCRTRSGQFNVRVAGQPRQVECRRPAAAPAPAAAPTGPARVPATPSPDMRELLRSYCIGLPSGPFTVTVGGRAVQLQCTGAEGRSGAVAPQVAAPVRMAQAPARAVTPAVPRGFRPVWNDDRLNPSRGLIAAPVAAPVEVAATRSAVVPLSVPQARPVVAAPAQAAAAGRYVQVGAFGVAENAARAVARLQAAGLPVSTQVVSRQGRPLQMVMAGPLDPGASVEVLGMVRAAGYADAYLRN